MWCSMISCAKTSWDEKGSQRIEDFLRAEWEGPQSSPKNQSFDLLFSRAAMEIFTKDLFFFSFVVQNVGLLKIENLMEI